MYSFAEAEARGAIDRYDWVNLLANGGPKDSASVATSWTDHDDFPNFVGIVYTYMGFFAFEAWGSTEDPEWYGPYGTQALAAENLSSEAQRNLGYEPNPVFERTLYGV